MADEHIVWENYDEFGDSGARATYPVQCSALRKNGFVVVNGHPCKIVDISTSKPGMVHLVGLDIWTGRKYEEQYPSTDNIEVPVVKRIELALIDITDDGSVSMMSADGGISDDTMLPAYPRGLAEKMRELFDAGAPVQVTVQAAMDVKAIVNCKKVEY
ncbi:translation initiation factor eIF-5A [Parathielavia hyrcaniae]|uniref:Eukaryotic translation initiation factor 5A n=1 Tax=Parathielavia hyrcaniae TaxID=113614 RepID=A0AAN6Q0I1_9PEZI|nr:translation initiation factor eIF-5A [Parathielavia hyrcaniae]